MQYRRPGSELRQQRPSADRAELPGDHPDGERSAQRSCVGDEHGHRFRWRGGQSSEQHGKRWNDDNRRPQPDHHEESYRQLHARSNRHLYLDREQHRRLSDQWHYHGDRQPTYRNDIDYGHRHGLVVHAGRSEFPLYA